MAEHGESWHFSTMTNVRSARTTAATQRGVTRVAFNRRKYGRHLLVDVARISELTGFIVDAPHALGFFDITLVTHGTGSIYMDTARHAVRPGTVVFTTPGQVREWSMTQFDGWCLFFEESFTKEFLNDDAFLDRLPYFHIDPARATLALGAATARRIRTRLHAMQRELAHHRADSIDLLRAQLHEILLLFAREYATVHGVPSQRTTHPVVSRFLDLIDRDVTRRSRIADYARKLAVTPGHLSVLCTQYLGRRAKRVLDDTVLARAQRMLLYTDDTTGRIAASLGFADPSYFSRFFRRETGLTPTEFRQTRKRG